MSKYHLHLSRIQHLLCCIYCSYCILPGSPPPSPCSAAAHSKQLHGEETLSPDAATCCGTRSSGQKGDSRETKIVDCTAILALQVLGLFCGCRGLSGALLKSLGSDPAGWGALSAHIQGRPCRGWAGGGAAQSCHPPSARRDDDQPGRLWAGEAAGCIQGCRGAGAPVTYIIKTMKL